MYVGAGFGARFGVSVLDLLLKPIVSTDRVTAAGGSLLGGLAGGVSSSTRLFLLVCLEGIFGGPLGLGGILGGRSSSTTGGPLGLGGFSGGRSCSTTGGSLIGTMGPDLIVRKGVLIAFAFSATYTTRA